MNIYDVSQKAGVSIATVSRVINGNPNVSEKTKLKVLSVMKEIGYTPNVFARGLGLNTMKTIGIMCADCSDPFLANAVYYLEQNLHKNGYDSFLCCTGYELANKKKYIKLLLSKRVDAIIMAGSVYVESNKNDNDYIFEAAAKIPIMLINGYLAHPNIYSTLCDDQQAIYDSTNRFIMNGKKHILYMHRSKSYSGMQKLAGYKNAIASNNMKIDDNMIIFCQNDINETRKLLLSLYNGRMKFDAVIAAEDLLAVAAIKFAKETGIKIPEQLEVIGYNNSLISTCCDPELTSIDNHVESLCMTTVSSLMRVLSKSIVPNKTTISSDLVSRGTTML